MTIPFYIDLGSPGHPVYLASNHAPFPALALNLRETHTFIATYGVGGVKTAIAGERRLVFKAGPDGSVLAQDASATAVGTGVDSFTLVMDSDQLRSLLVGKTEVTVIVQLEIIAEDEKVQLSEPVDIIIRNAYATDADGLPNPASDAAFALLSGILQEGDAVSFDVDAVARTITINFDPDGELTAEDGWSPLLRIVTDSARRVIEVYDWTGGTGTKPVTGYISASGITTTLASAVDVRGASGAAGATGSKGWSPLWRIISDGDRRVLEVHDWAGGEGTKPATLGYLSSGGFTSTIGDAADLRGPVGPSGGDPGDQGEAGWSPVFGIVEYLEGRYLQVVDWIGGEGTKPATGQLVGTTGFVETYEDATDIRGSSASELEVFHPGVYYIEPETGVDDDADAPQNGTFVKPWNTLEYALLQTSGEAGPLTFIIGRGSCFLYANPANYDLLSREIRIIGRGPGLTTLSVDAFGANGEDIPSNQTASPNLLDAEDGRDVRLTSDGSVKITSIDTRGGTGGNVTDPGSIGAVIAGKGGNAGSVWLRGFEIGDGYFQGGAGGTASGSGSQGGIGGDAAASLKLIDCRVTGTLNHARGAGGIATGSGATNGANGAGNGVIKTWNTRKGTIVSPLGTQTHTNELAAFDLS